MQHPPRGQYQAQPIGQIARRFSVSVKDLAVANNITNPSSLQAGQELVIPGTSAAPAAESSAMDDRSDVEQAVLGHGPNLGPLNEGPGLRLLRDSRFPVRITVQFYKATSHGVVSDSDLDGIAKSIGSVYEHAEFVGSLVLPEDDARRPTAWQKIPREWFPW